MEIAVIHYKKSAILASIKRSWMEADASNVSLTDK